MEKKNIDVMDIQKELLNIMVEFHKVCVDNNIKYYMLGGTCLGAIRHKGFIPWDDDMDVGMPRGDYDRFCNMAHSILPKHLELRFYKTEKDSPFHFVKLINKNTTLVEPAFCNYVEGIYIDVFPLDGMEKYNFMGKLRAQAIWICYDLLIYHSTTIIKKKLYKKAIKLFAQCISSKFLHFLMEMLMTLNKMESPPLLCNFLGAWKSNEIIPSQVFGKPILYQFENHQFYGPNDANQYLKKMYGDYMKLPPKDKQVCRHNYHYVDLNKPYQEYIKENCT